MESFLASRPSVVKLPPPARITTPRVVDRHLSGTPAPPTPGTNSPDPCATAAEISPPKNGSSGETPVRPNHPGAPEAPPARLETIRDEAGAIRRIVVICGCGQRHELDCVY